VVHDIEYGYGDPLRCKVAPEFSVRLKDEAYAKENETISRIQVRLTDRLIDRPQCAKCTLAEVSVACIHAARTGSA
jgi:hypothetical protein